MPLMLSFCVKLGTPVTPEKSNAALAAARLPSALNRLTWMSVSCRVTATEVASTYPPLARKILPVPRELAVMAAGVTLRWAPQGSQAISQEQRERFIRRYADETGADHVTVSESIASLMPFVVFRALAWCQGFASSQSIDRTGRLGEFTASEFIASLGFLFEQYGGESE